MAAPAISFAQNNQTGGNINGSANGNSQNGGFDNPAFWAALAASSERGGGGGNGYGTANPAFWAALAAGNEHGNGNMGGYGGNVGAGNGSMGRGFANGAYWHGCLRLPTMEATAIARATTRHSGQRLPPQANTATQMATI